MDQQSPSAIEQLQEHLENIAGQGPKAFSALPAEAKRLLVNQISMALTAQSDTPLPVMTAVGAVPGAMIAEGLADAWSGLPGATRLAVSQWIRSVQGDKRAQIATKLGAQVLATPGSDPVQAAELLLLAPDSKESVARLASEFLGADASLLDRLRLPEAAAGGGALARRLAKATQLPKVQEYRRLRALQLIVEWIAVQQALPDIERSDLLGSAREIRKGLTGLTSEPLSRWLQQRPEARQCLDGATAHWDEPHRVAPAVEQAPDDVDRTAAPAPVTPLASDVHTPPTEPMTTALPPEPEGSDNVLLGVKKRVEALQNEATLLTALVHMVEAERSANVAKARTVIELSAALTAMTAQFHATQARAEGAEHERDSLRVEERRLRDELARVRDEAAARAASADAERAEATATLARMDAEQVTLRDEIAKLQLRVTVNAEGRVEELRNRIARAVSQAQRQVPERRSPMEGAAGTIVLARFYELLEGLEENGVAVNGLR